MRVAERETKLALPASAAPAAARAWRLTDEAGHFVLRLALCKTPDSRAWLLNREVELFRMRLATAGVAVCLATLAESGGAPRIRPIPKAEVDALRGPLDAVARGPRYGRTGDTSTTRYFGVPFEAVTSLLAATSTGRPAFVEADGVDRISLPQLAEAIPAMPLCMRNMLAALRDDHHLRHGARMQLGLFLKACGLTMDESLTLFKTEFGRGTITAEKFDRQYAYNIRHYYGKEGHRKSLNAFSCTKIMGERPGAGEHHGSKGGAAAATGTDTRGGT
ncbi:hypothetical protein I4F81_000297 [Pyropia yezoensis]|uniref:Uncharacterized protein n=1 Tax=Pyropia yezoensis TaxID=2788 RepID=A0ACC3BJL3_PYRYE|nr:hypothetical protein I4F81_000297 [Neopyropia yezoensis]